MFDNPDPLFFQNVPNPKFTKQEMYLVNQIDDYWVNFATSSNPNGGDSAFNWPKYTYSTDENINLDLSLSTGSGYRDEKCDFWDLIEQN